MNHPTARRHSISLYPEHTAIIDACAKERGIRGRRQYFSPTIQYIIEDWHRLRRVQSVVRSTSREEATRERAS